MKICPKCNSLCEDSASFCQECGAPLPTPNDNAHTQENQKQQESQFQQNAYYQNAYQNNYNQNNYYRNGATAGIMPRNLVLAIVFSFLTCGIYSIYWMIKLNDEVNQLAGEPQATSGGMVFLFSLIPVESMVFTGLIRWENAVTASEEYRGILLFSTWFSRF